MKRNHCFPWCHRTLLASLFVALPVPSLLNPGDAYAGGVDKIVAGVHAVWCGSDATPMFALNTSAVPIVAGNELTASCPSVVGIASTVGDGRAVAFGHEGFFQDGHIEQFDNLLLATNAIQWLDVLGRKKVMVTANHGEWAGYDGIGSLRRQMEQLGDTVTRCDGPITAEKLQGIGVVFIGNIGGTITEGEIASLDEFLQSGGGLFLLGVGWSWSASHRDLSLDDYPMNRIGALCGVRWTIGAIVDPVNVYNGSALFSSFYPSPYVTDQTVPNAMQYITVTTSAHAADLRSVLRSDQSLRARYSNAHCQLGTALTVYPPSSPVRQTIFDFSMAFINAYPQYFQRGYTYNTQTESGIAWVRERVHRTLADALPLGPLVKSQIASAIRLAGREISLWSDYSLLLHDNSGLDSAQKEFIYQFLVPIPPDMQNLRSMAVPQFLGSNVPKVLLDGNGGSVNINWDRIGVARYNGFPDGFQAPDIDWYSSVVLHYVNHIVDAYYIEGNEVLRSRRNSLIAAAGYDDLNYLGSRYGAAYLHDNPQEFFARTAYLWFEDTKRTLDLGLARFAAGHSAPLDQALFFVEVYSHGGSAIDFYNIDTLGVITRKAVPLSRDARGHVNGLAVDGVHYVFTLDDQGNVLDYALPVQLVALQAVSDSAGGICVVWKTLSEINNYGFEVQKSDSLPRYRFVPGAFIPGHGTTTASQEYSWTDPNGRAGTYYRLKQLDLDGAVHFSEGVLARENQGVSHGGSSPVSFSLSQNYPNPFNPSTTIRYGLPAPSQVSLTVFNTLGQHIATLVDESEDAGFHDVQFDGSGLASGAYFYRLRAGAFVSTKVLMLEK
jgi:hypothetical protein